MIIKDKDKIISLDNNDINYLKIMLDNYWLTIIKEKDENLTDNEKKCKYKFINIINNYFSDI